MSCNAAPMAGGHSGEWVALRDGELLGSHADYGALQEALTPEQRAAALFICIPEE